MEAMGENNDPSLQKAWDTWRECLGGEDVNSIFQQIYRLTLDEAIFRLVVESRKVVSEKFPENPPLNNHLHLFIDRSFFQSQVASIRRIADKSSYPLSGEKGIYSLYALIKDIRRHRNDLTREVYFRLRKLSYDYLSMREKEEKFIRNQFERSNERAIWIPPEFDPEPAAEAHATFDRLCGKNHAERKPDDIIDDKVFGRLEEKLKTGCGPVTKFVDKFIAHSATSESRALENDGNYKIAWKQIRDAHRTLYEVAEFLALTLFSEEHVPLTWMKPDFLDNWGIPIFEAIDINHLKEILEQYRAETESWRLHGIDGVWMWVEQREA